MKLTKCKPGGVFSNRGFAVSGILYPILILTLFLIVQILTMMASRKAVLDKNKQQLLDSVNASNKIYNNEELSILLAEQAELIKSQGEKINSLTTGQSNMLNRVYPIGSIYISYSNMNPGSLFGGTWVAYGAGRTLVGVDTSQSEFNSVGKTGGEKKHTLTVNEIPAHNHFISNNGTTVPIGQNLNGGYSTEEIYSPNNPRQLLTSNTGSNGAHNNLQPYITVYMWRRTA